MTGAGAPREEPGDRVAGPEPFRRAVGLLGERVPPGPFRPPFWRSPVRGPWLTAVLGSVLLVGVTVVFVTGLLSWTAYNPGLPGNDPTPGTGWLAGHVFGWPTRPAWLFRLNEGVHVTLGLVLVPVLLGKLWSVLPRLFTWPPVTSPAQALERLSLLLLVGGALFEFVTGVLNVQYWYVFPGSFYALHFWGGWVFMSAFVLHVCLKFGRMRSSLGSRRLRDELRTPTAATVPEPPDADGLVSPAPDHPSVSRRGVLALVGAGAGVVLVSTVGQSLGGPLRRTALLAPRNRDPGTGPNGFQVNRTAAAAGIDAQAAGAGWQLELRGAGAPVVLTRADLLALPQHTAGLPIACVEGWSTGDQTWTGVRLRDLAALAGQPAPSSVLVESLEQGGAFATARLRGNQVADGDSLLALTVNGADLSPDHGFPARVIVPANPGVHNTKWVARMTFEA
ncbi:molybdopterin-dependent oxidoreductase [Modestobacter sp. L9-4]|uniref:molybdopterin-dependent oxidoreductase n=1 Tax=Modestobacter sp. L9-4 TaxID=2851567 RepID=UPI001C78BB1E|nr:molybdopterin-dependent oxidoreductase [Modestobacter sp. L9-4]QXG75953.1 molybdopterin-dependent oxidoreductase [Modestobacter sp. L9-4]